MLFIGSRSASVREKSGAAQPASTLAIVSVRSPFVSHRKLKRPISSHSCSWQQNKAFQFVALNDDVNRLPASQSAAVSGEFFALLAKYIFLFGYRTNREPPTRLEFSHHLSSTFADLQTHSPSGSGSASAAGRGVLLESPECPPSISTWSSPFALLSIHPSGRHVAPNEWPL